MPSSSRPSAPAGSEYTRIRSTPNPQPSCLGMASWRSGIASSDSDLGIPQRSANSDSGRPRLTSKPTA
eukprot:6415387-Alexandrium_andersonii.AAC.1